MINAFLLGAVAQVTLLLSGLVPFNWTIPTRYIGWLAGFGAGALIAAIADDLAPQALSLGSPTFAVWLLFGAMIFILLDRVVAKRFGGEGGGSGPLGIVLGALVDGVPESLIFGIEIATGMVISWAFLFAVMVSNIPQALAPSADLAQSGWSRTRVSRMWGAVVLLCGIAAAVGYFAAEVDPDATGAHAAAIAAGGLLTMLTNSLIPFAYERGDEWSGFFMVVGFATSYMFS
jgi:zinc transporter, ZIP family